jgi:WD40 repeat protein/serine/threonine protein kinase
MNQNQPDQPTDATGEAFPTPERADGSREPRDGSERPGDFVGPYKLMSVLGEGGFGTVWLAERREPMVQRVAIKIIKPGMDSKSVIARFEQERQALAVMDHPNVARVFDGGVTERGRPYFVMEHVQGEPITTFCDRHTYTIRQRLELFIPVCEAVQHAHMKGIIHRDIKPSNVLVSIKDGNAIVKVIDFGIAKAISHTMTDKTIFTETGQLIGTPEYMSPEQAEMGAVDIDTRTDVYSLGVVLYELLVGALPFDAKELRARGYAEIQRVIREVEPPTPSKRLTTIDDKSGAEIARKRQEERHALTRLLRSELEWIPLKAMRKDRRERYRGPDDLADDVRAFLEGRALAAGPVSAGYRLRKYVKRHRGSVVAASAVAIALVLGIGVATWGLLRANEKATEATQAATRERAALAKETEARKEAEAATEAERKARETIEYNSYVANVQMAGEALENRQWDRLRERLDACPEHLRGWEWGWLRSNIDRSLLRVVGGTKFLTGAVLNADGKTLLTASGDGSLRIWDTATGLELRGMQGPENGCSAVDYSADGTRVAAAWQGDPVVRIFRAEDWKEMLQLQGHTDVVIDIQFSGDCHRIITSSADHTTRVWDATTGDSIGVLSGHSDVVTSGAFSPDGEQILTASFDKTVRLWDAGSGQYLRTFERHAEEVTCVAFSADRSRVASASERSLCVWNATSGELVSDISFPGGLWAVVFGQQSNHVLATFRDGTIRRLDADSGELLDTWADDEHKVSRIARSGDGSLFATACDYATARVWDANMSLEPARSPARGIISSCALSPDSAYAAFAYTGGLTRVVDCISGRVLAAWDGPDRAYSAVVFDETGEIVMSENGRGGLTSWSVLSLESVRSTANTTPKRTIASAICRARDLVALAETVDKVAVRSISTGKIVATLEGHLQPVMSVAFSPDGRRIATGSMDTTARLWNASSGEVTAILDVHRRIIERLAFSPNGEWLVTSTPNRTVIWSVSTGELMRELTSHSGQVFDASFSHDGARVVTASEDGTARVWDAATGVMLVELRAGDSAVSIARFSSDDTQIVTVSEDGTFRVWDSVPYRERYPKIKESREADARMRPLVEARIAAGESAKDVRVSMLNDPSLTERERAAVMWITTEYMEREREQVEGAEDGEMIPPGDGSGG